MKFQTPEGGCMWPHHVDAPICVYDRDSFDKYKSGEFKPPMYCICGALLSYEEPICVCLVEGGIMTGEMLLTVELPVKFLERDIVGFDKTEDELQTYDVPERVRKKLNAEADLIEQSSMGAAVPKKETP